MYKMINTTDKYLIIDEDKNLGRLLGIYLISIPNEGPNLKIMSNGKYLFLREIAEISGINIEMLNTAFRVAINLYYLINEIDEKISGIRTDNS